MKLTPIIANFKHDGQQYYAGELRMLSPELCGYFCNAGWAGDGPPRTAPPEPVTLEVHSTTHGVHSRFVSEK